MPNLEDRSHIYNPWDWVAQLYPWHCVPILVAFYDMHGLQWDYSLILVITRDKQNVLVTDIVLGL
jgi:hypothetical protein